MEGVAEGEKVADDPVGDLAAVDEGVEEGSSDGEDLEGKDDQLPYTDL